MVDMDCEDNDMLADFFVKHAMVSLHQLTTTQALSSLLGATAALVAVTIVLTHLLCRCGDGGEDRGGLDST